jgi:hypothetical protein
MRPIRACTWVDDNGECENICEGNTDYCASHNHAIRKAAKVKVKVVREVKRITEKRAKQNREYLEMREQFLDQYPMCQIKDCTKKSTEIHHIKGKANDLLTNPENFLAICPDCHKEITEHSAKAIQDGYSKLRST